MSERQVNAINKKEKFDNTSQSTTKSKLSLSGSSFFMGFYREERSHMLMPFKVPGKPKASRQNHKL
jgi:hypothetical protein